MQALYALSLLTNSKFDTAAKQAPTHNSENGNNNSEAKTTQLHSLRTHPLAIGVP